MISELELAVRGVRDAASAVAASGRPVVGIVGRDVPGLLVAASGALPFRIAPDAQQIEEADTIMGRAIDRAASRVLAAVLSGSLDFLSGLLVSRDTEASVRLFYTLQELHRRGRTAIPVHLVDQVHQDRESTVRFNVSEIERMWRTVESWTSASITTESLQRALTQLAAVRTELERIRRARSRGSVSGTAALHGYLLAAASEPAEALRLLSGTSTQSRTEAPAEPSERFPVFLTGSAPLDDQLYRTIEAAGGRVVGEDHDWGDPILSDRLPESIDPDRAGVVRTLVLSRLHGAPASASSTMAARAAATREAVVASGARGLLSVVRPHDDAPAWDWRHQRERAAVPAVMVSGEAADDPEQIAAAIESLRVAS